MGFSNQTMQQQFPYSADAVFSALFEAVKMADMEIKQSDNILKRATIGVGVSLLSWGETVSISIHSQSDNSCIVTIDSSLNFSANLFGSHKHQKNIDKILYSISGVLSGEVRNNHQADNGVNGNLVGKSSEGVKISTIMIVSIIIIIIIPTIIVIFGGGL